MDALERHAFLVTVVALVIVMGVAPFIGSALDIGDVVDQLEGKNLQDFLGEINVSEAQLETVKSVYNNNINSVPEVRDLLANERINLEIEGFGEFGIVNREGEMESVQFGALDDPTLKIETDTATVLGLATGLKDPKEALKDGSISFYGVGFWNWLRFEFTKFFFGAASFLGMV
jgi:hypothetical protein